MCACMWLEYSVALVRACMLDSPWPFAGSVATIVFQSMETLSPIAALKIQHQSLCL